MFARQIQIYFKLVTNLYYGVSLVRTVNKGLQKHFTVTNVVDNFKFHYFNLTVIKEHC